MASRPFQPLSIFANVRLFEPLFEALLGTRREWFRVHTGDGLESAEPGGVATVGIFPDKFLAFLLGSLRCQMVDWGHKVMLGILIIELFQLENTAHCRPGALVWTEQGKQQQNMTRSPGEQPHPSGE